MSVSEFDLGLRVRIASLRDAITPFWDSFEAPINSLASAKAAQNIGELRMFSMKKTGVRYEQ